MVGKRFDEADHDLNLPHAPLNQDRRPTDDDCSNNGHDKSAANVDGDEDDEDDGDVAGPTVEAHVDLAKTPCKCFVTLYRQNIPNCMYSIQSLS